LTYLVLLCLSVSALAAGPCDSDADKFYKCLGEARKEGGHDKGGSDKGGSDKRAAFEDIEKKRAACFTDKGCKVPAHEEKGKGPDGKGDGKGKEDFAKMKTCIEAAVTKVKACVGPTHFPEPPKEEFEHGGKEKGVGGPEKGPGGPQGVDPRARAGADCAAATAVNQCLDALKPPQKESHEHGGSDKKGGGDWAQKFAADCQKRKDTEQKCAAQMTPACQKSLTDTKKTVCDCGNKQKPDFVACIGADGEKHFDMFLHEVCETKCDAQPQNGAPHKA